MGLFMPAWMGRNEKKALRFVENETDPSKLAEIAREAPLFDVCMLAVKKLSVEMHDTKAGQRALADVTVAAKISLVAERAMEALTNQSLLADVARTAHSDAMRIAAVRKISDQGQLADFIKTANDTFVCDEAFQKLTNQNLLADIAKNATMDVIKEEAIKRLEDQCLLVDVVKSMRSCSGSEITGSELSRLRKTVLDMLTDEELLLDIVKNEQLPILRKKALEKIITPELRSEATRALCGDNLHEWVFTCDKYDSEYIGGEDMDRGSKYYKIYQCKLCGEEKKEYIGRMGWECTVKCVNG